MTSNPETYAIGELYLIDIDIEVGHLRAMRTTDSTLPWVAEDGALYADEAVNVIRRLIVTDPGEEVATGPEIDLSNVEGGYVEIDGRGWVPIFEYEQAIGATTEAADRLAALTKAAEFTRSDGTAPFKLSQSPEQAQTRRVIDAAKWVLTGE